MTRSQHSHVSAFDLEFDAVIATGKFTFGAAGRQMRKSVP